MQGMQVDAFDDRWYSTEGDTLWNYHGDYRVRVLLKKNISNYETITLTVTHPEGRQLYSERKTVEEANDDGTLFFTIPNDAVACMAFTATVVITEQSVKHSITPNIAGCGE